MNPERWERIHLLVEQALARPEEARLAFVFGACGKDAGLRGEVLSLLAACERSPETHVPPEAWFGLLTGPEPPRFADGDRVAGRYRVRGLLGQGGMGDVYEARDEELSIDVALKALRLVGNTDEAHRRLKAEGLHARSIWHPNVCRLYDLGRHGEGADATWFLTMELLRGETLSQHLQRMGPLPLHRVQCLAEQMAAGLGAAHNAGIVHRDFKTNNVMLVSKDGAEHAVVMDFGIAQAASRRPAGREPKLEPGTLLGTPAYMAPEQVRGEELGPAADIYAFGVVLYEMVTGTVPFGGDSAMEVARRRLIEGAPSPRRAVPELDERWENAILRCLDREPRHRFGRIEEVTEALAGRAVAGRGPAEPAESVDSPLTRRYSLPSEKDSFVGREDEAAEIQRHLRGGSRLVTLVGAGGMGKTRLAIHHAWTMIDDWSGGVWFCDLTEAQTADEIASAVAGGLGLQLGRGDPVEQLGHAIAGRGRCLVILDNFEHVREPGALILARWLARAASARFLVTSREKVGLGDGETVLAIGPLSIERGVELLVARAQRLRPGLELHGPEAESAREIVRLVDGMPLAIELAGARMRVMTATQIVAQMRRRFSLLTGGGNVRHETLFLVIDSSWELLRPWERSAWAQCAAFEGGFTLEAAEAVVDLASWPDSPWVIDVVQSLVDKSLLRRWVPQARTGAELPEARFGMFASLQEYARMRLHETQVSAGGPSSPCSARAVEQRHGAWFARCGTPDALEKLRADRGPNARQRVERELDNLIAACRRAVARGDNTIAVATYRALWAVLDLRGPFGPAVDLGREILRDLSLAGTERAQAVRTLAQAEWFSGMVEDSRTHLEAALALARDARDVRLEAQVLGDIGGMLSSLGQMDEGAVVLETALDAFAAAGDPHGQCNLLNTLSVTRRGQGRLVDAREFADRALEIARRVGDRRLEGTILSNLGLILQDQGEAEEARLHYRAALAIHEEVGYRRMEGNTHNNLGSLSCDQGRMEDAGLHLDAALVIHRESGARLSQAITLTNLGVWRQARQEYDAARAHFEEALALVRELGNRRLEGSVLDALGRWHEERGEADAARFHYRSALAIHENTGDRSAAGAVLAHMARLLQREGSVDAAREALTVAEHRLREAGAVLELGLLLCTRAVVERQSGNAEAAEAAVREAELFAARFGAGPDSELGRGITALHGSFPGLPRFPHR